MEDNKKQTPPLSGDTASSVGSDIAAGLRQIDRVHSQLKEALAKRREERDKNKNEEIEIPPTPTFSSYDDVIENGSIYQKATLYVNHFDTGRTFGSGTLTEEQVARLREKIYNTTEENRREGLIYIKTFNAFLQYGKFISTARSDYQREAAKLTGLIELWEGVQGTYQHWKDMVANGILETMPENIKAPFQCLPDFGIFKDRYKAQITVFPDGNVVLEDTKLWEAIQEQAEETEYYLSVLKGYIEPLSDYIYSEGEPPLWAILPHRLEMWMDYPDAIEEQRQPDKAKYFRFILRKRKESGETITPEEERLAVYPDYNEIQTDTKTEDFAKGQLSDIFYLWEIEKRKKTPKRGRPKKTK